MSAMQRNKGAAAERELAKLLRDELGIDVSRNLEQTRSGGHDLIGLPGFALEVKRYRRILPSLLRTWWIQAETQAAAIRLVPALAYREDRGEWQVAVPLHSISSDIEPWPGYAWTCTLSLQGFCALVRERITNSTLEPIREITQ